MLVTLLFSIITQLPSEVIKLQEEVKQTQVVLANKEKELNKLLASLPEKLGPVETLEVQGYGQCDAQKILSGPVLIDIGKYRIVKQYGDTYGFTSWLNDVRAQYHLSPVSHDSNLSNWAHQNNEQQVTRGMGHFVMGPARRQNAAMGTFANVPSMWMNSPGHRAALLDPTIKWIGIAGLGAYWTFNAK